MLGYPAEAEVLRNVILLSLILICMSIYVTQSSTWRICQDIATTLLVSW